MVRYFKSNNPSLLLFLFFYLLVLTLPLLVLDNQLSVTYSSTAPFSTLIFSITNFLFNNNYFILLAIALTLIFVQALLVNVLVNNAKIFKSDTYVPALTYLLLSALFVEYLVLSPALMASTLFVFILKKLIAFYQKKECALDIFDSGMLVGISSLFYFPSIVLLGIVFLSLAVFRGFYWREWLTSLLGFLTVYFLTGTYYFLIDQLPLFFQQHFTFFYSINFDFAQPRFLILGGITFLFLIFSVFSIQSNYLKSPIHIRNLFMLVGWSLFFLFLSFLFTSTLTLNHFLILNVPLSLIFTYLFLHIEKRWIADLVYLVYLSVIVFFQYFTI